MKLKERSMAAMKDFNVAKKELIERRSLSILLKHIKH